MCGHFRSLLAQFGLTRKSRRGLTASEAEGRLGWNWSRLRGAGHFSHDCFRTNLIDNHGIKKQAMTINFRMPMRQ